MSRFQGASKDVKVPGGGGGAAGASGGGTNRELPVFTFPNNLTFYADDKDSLRQILTVYNPYEFPIKFRVYSTAPKLYSVMDAQGTVKPGFCADIVVRHNASGQPRYGHPEKFRIQIYDSLNSSATDHAFGSLLGKKTIEAVLHEKRSAHSGVFHSSLDTDDETEFTRIPSGGEGSRLKNTPSAQWQPGRRTSPVFPPSSGQFAPPSPLILFVAILCITVLCLPTENTIQSHFPIYLHLTVNQKLVAAYILGLITMVILRT